MLDLSFREIFYYTKRITDAAYDEKKFWAKLHGAKLRTPRTSSLNKVIDKKRSKELDLMAQSMLERMKSGGRK